MSDVDISKLREWIGKSVDDSDELSVRHARLMAATIGYDTTPIEKGAPLPPLWHWIYFLSGLPERELGHDGHPQRGGFLPPVPLPNRMWAGGRVKFLKDLPLGAEVRKRSTIQSVEHKQGRSGDLVFVTVRHDVSLGSELAISEEHDIVYKEASSGAPAKQEATTVKPDLRETFLASSTTLFRYSALTFNGHRIHYDQDYCRSVEGYPNLVIHGPLNATLLAGYAQRLAGTPLKSFDYRGVQPALLGNALSLNAVRKADGFSLWTGLPNEHIAMRAEAGF
ncbi:acyl-CoA dehydrogenase [Trinickia violacea]|uniref:Acyl-CoA dehydrogenase n=1 Tax=Trinickia violacea TaxID=2571746 RepID=A0A4V1EIM7_9BURK|nr:MaoC family dehydratase N-terminal domain-containing protein [Trinickia violacea]QCP54310.1 acyl-CoA dehydrogenase [Trinickia violacea]